MFVHLYSCLSVGFFYYSCIGRKDFEGVSDFFLLLTTSTSPCTHPSIRKWILVRNLLSPRALINGFKPKCLRSQLDKFTTNQSKETCDTSAAVILVVSKLPLGAPLVSHRIKPRPVLDQWLWLARPRPDLQPSAGDLSELEGGPDAYARENKPVRFVWSPDYNELNLC